MTDLNKTRSLWIILGITVLNAIGLTIVFPLFPFLLGKYVAAPRVAFVMSMLVSVFAAATFFAAPVFGALSDRYGRKPIFIASLIGSAVGYVLLGVGGALWVLFLGRIIDGLTAGDQTALMAYISDVTEPEERGKWFGYLGGAIGAGFLVGPGLGGLLGSISITLPFFVTAAISLVTTTVVLVLLPESLPIEKRTTHLTVKSFNTFSHFGEIFSIVKARTLLIMGLFFYAGLLIWQFSASIFLKDVFMWGPKLIGGIFVLVGISDILSRVIVLPRALKIWSERTVGIIGLCGMVLGLSLLFVSSYIHAAAFIIAAVACIVLGEGLFDPSYNAQLSLSVEESKQGLLQGSNQSLQSLYRVVVPLAAGALYTYNHSVVFAVGVFLLIIGLLLFARIKPQSAA